jgi:hypothetical protein
VAHRYTLTQQEERLLLRALAHYSQHLLTFADQGRVYITKAAQAALDEERQATTKLTAAIGGKCGSRVFQQQQTDRRRS